MRRCLSVLTLSLGLAAPAVAQTLVSNPNLLQFDSATHYSAPVQTYHVDFTQVGATAPTTGFDIPAANVTVLDPTIVRVQLDLHTQTGGVLIGFPFGVQFTASVIAVNVTGVSARSEESNPFVFAPVTPGAVSNVVVKR